MRHRAAVSLGPRLETVARFVPARARVADVGTDHGELAAALVQSDAASHVIATDRAAEPLAMAAARLRAVDRTRFQLRLGDGLRVLAPGEVDTVVLAGLGGTSIVRILDAAPDVVDTLVRIVVQPELHWCAVRRWIAKRGATLVDEVLVRDGARFRLVCAIEPNRSSEHAWSEVDLVVGPRLRAAADPMWGAWVRHRLRTLDRALAEAARADVAPDRLHRLRVDRALFTDALRELRSPP
jgi:tRNA (adenine22-N1)-methyltransferase